MSTEQEQRVDKSREQVVYAYNIYLLAMQWGADARQLAQARRSWKFSLEMFELERADLTRERARKPRRAVLLPEAARG